MTNTAAGRLRLLSSPDSTSGPVTERNLSLSQASEAFGRRLAAEGRSPNTISAYLRDLRCMTAVLQQRQPDLTVDRVTTAMIDEMLTSPEVTVSARGGIRSPASMHRFKAAVRSFFAWAEETGRRNTIGAGEPDRVIEAASASTQPPELFDGSRETEVAQGASRQVHHVGGAGPDRHRIVPRHRYPVAGVGRFGHRGCGPRCQASPCPRQG